MVCSNQVNTYLRKLYEHFRDGDANFSNAEDRSSSRVESGSTGTGVTSLGTSTVYSLIETSHPVFGKVKRLWNSPMESHREVRER